MGTHKESWGVGKGDKAEDAVRMGVNQNLCVNTATL